MAVAVAVDRFPQQVSLPSQVLHLPAPRRQTSRIANDPPTSIGSALSGGAGAAAKVSWPSAPSTHAVIKSRNVSIHVKTETE